jgi:hypothetical protein
MAGEHLGIGRVCPRCRARSDTLGGVCPACGGPRQLPVTTLLIIGLALVAGWLWLLMTDPVVGIALVGVAFVVLVAAIGVMNALADRG